MLAIISRQIDFALQDENCQKCKKVFKLDQVDPDYDGALATYDEDKFCNMGCLYACSEKA